jgi:PLP dependent protein
MTPQDDPVVRLRAIEAKIASAAAFASREVSRVTLIAVSKTFEVEAIRPVLSAGHRDFGENRVQEALQKWPALRDAFPQTQLHLIGPLQSNKARDAVRVFDAIHSVDRESLAESLASELTKTARRPLLFVQVNTGLEPQKSGATPRDAAPFVRRLREVHGLAVSGLMCIPPESQQPSPHFALLHQLSRDCDAPLLSMGMSGDFELAVKLGATHVRVGSAIFGARQTSTI